jgi:hypothetical protein
MTHVYDRKRWIAHLPDADEETAVDLVVVGWLLPGPAERAQIVAGDLCLTFATIDVLDMELFGDPLEKSDGGARRVRLVVRRGAALWDVCPRECVDGRLPSGRQPFALSSRPLNMEVPSRTRFAELEKEFLIRAGMKPGLPS